MTEQRPPMAATDRFQEPDLDPRWTDDDDDFDCTHCGGEGTCDDNANPLWDCDDNLHPCHACGGSGRRADQRMF